MALQTISESVYVGLCLKIGTPQQVAIRRDVVDIKELLEHKVTRADCDVRMMSGSRREGFRFQDSDCDSMYWADYHRVLWDFSQSRRLPCTTHTAMHLFSVTVQRVHQDSLYFGYHWREQADVY